MALEQQPQSGSSGTRLNAVSAEGSTVHPRISWGALFSGIFVAIAAQISLTLLGSGIGLAAANPTTQPGTGMAIGAGIWWVITSLVSLFLGGWVAAQLSGSHHRFIGLWHGATTW